VAGRVSRENGGVLEVLEETDQQTRTAVVADRTAAVGAVDTDAIGVSPGARDGSGQGRLDHSLGQRGRLESTRGDRVQKVHGNTLAGLWAALQTFLRLFCGVSEHYLISTSPCSSGFMT